MRRERKIDERGSLDKGETGSLVDTGATACWIRLEVEEGAMDDLAFDVLLTKRGLWLDARVRSTWREVLISAILGAVMEAKRDNLG